MAEMTRRIEEHVDAVGGVEDPGPDGARDHERERHGKQEDAPERPPPPRMCWSMRMASSRPITMQPITNTSVNTMLTKTSLVQNRGVLKTAW